MVDTDNRRTRPRVRTLNPDEMAEAANWYAIRHGRPPLGLRLKVWMRSEIARKVIIAILIAALFYALRLPVVLSGYETHVVEDAELHRLANERLAVLTVSVAEEREWKRGFEKRFEKFEERVLGELAELRKGR